MDRTPTSAARDLRWPWVVATVVGWVLGMIVVAVSLREPFTLRGVATVRAPLGLALLPGIASTVGVVGLGAAVGIAQWSILRAHLKGAGSWIPATLGGWCVGFLAVSATVSPLFVDASSGVLTLLGVALVGATVATGQWVFLRSRLPHASWWLVATVGAITGGDLANESIVRAWSAGSPGTSAMANLSRYVVPWAVQAAIIGIVTALTMEWLLAGSRRKSGAGVLASPSKLSRPGIGTLPTIRMLLMHPRRAATMLSVSSAWWQQLARVGVTAWAVFVAGNVLLARLTYEPGRSDPGAGGIIAEFYLVGLSCALAGVALWHVVVLIAEAAERLRGRPAAIPPEETGARAVIVFVAGASVITGLLLLNLVAQEMGLRAESMVVPVMIASLVALLATLSLIVTTVVSCVVSPRENTEDG